MTEPNEEKAIDRIRKYLDQFDWNPEKIVEEDDQYTITLLVEVEGSKNLKIFIKFAENSKWIYFSSKFMASIPSERKLELYEKLLSLNYTTTLSKFGLAQSGSIYVMIELPLPDLNYSEFISALRRLVNDINSYKEKVLEKV